VSPNAETVEGDPSYASLRAIPGGVEAVVIGTRPSHAEGTVHDCADLWIKQIWMHRAFGEGSVSPAAADWGREHGITVIEGGCPLMFGGTCDTGHHVMCRLLTLAGKVPRTV